MLVCVYVLMLYEVRSKISKPCRGLRDSRDSGTADDFHVLEQRHVSIPTGAFLA